MSAVQLREDTGVVSRLQLAKALKEDPYSEPPENSAIFLRQRNRITRYGPPRGAFNIARPMTLLVPPVLGNTEGYFNNFSSQPNIPPVLQPPTLVQQERRPSIPQISTSSPRNIPEERRGSASKPATLLDVRQSMLDVRQNLQTAVPFTTASSQRNSIILQQNKSLLDANVKQNGAPKLSNSRPVSTIAPLSRPISTYSNNSNSRPNSSYKSSNDDDKDSSGNSSTNSKPKSQKSKKVEKNASSDNSDLAPKLPPIKSVTNQSIILEKVKEENDSSDSSEEVEEEDDDESSEDDTPLALKPTPPKIKVAAPPKITTKKNNGGRIEAWLEHVSGSPDGHSSRSSTPTSHSPRSSTPTSHSPRSSTPNQSPTRTHSPRVRKTSEHSIKGSSPLSPYRMSSYIADDARNRRPKSTFIPDDLQAPTPDFHQPRKRSNSDYVPKIRPNSTMYEQPPQVPLIGRVSPSPRQDSGYWAKDTLLVLSEDMRHVSLMNDPNASNSRRRSVSFSNVSNNNSKPLNNNVTKVMNRHKREGSGSNAHNSRPSTPQLNLPPQSNFISQVPAVKPSKSKDSLNPRNSLYMNQRISSEQLKTSNRNSVYLHQHQQKNRIKS